MPDAEGAVQSSVATSEGLAAGKIARQRDFAQNTMSAHLGVLARVRLIHAERHSRSIIYRADLQRVQGLMLYLVKDCCGERACLPALPARIPC